MGLGESSRGDHLTGFSAQEAFNAYEAVRHRLPGITTTEVNHRQAKTLVLCYPSFDRNRFFVDSLLFE